MTVLMTLLVLWVIVVPALTIAGTYVFSGIYGRRLQARTSQRPRTAPDRFEVAHARHLASRVRTHPYRPRGHVLTRH